MKLKLYANPFQYCSSERSSEDIGFFSIIYDYDNRCVDHRSGRLSSQCEIVLEDASAQEAPAHFLAGGELRTIWVRR